MASATPQQLAEINAVGNQYGIAPQTLLGVFGTESGFGTNLGPSSKGALGPFQFLPSTGATYGLTSSGANPSILNFSASLTAAAKYLKSLGANSNPTSNQTANALNSYSGGGGIGYINSVLTNAGLPPTLTYAKPIIGGTVGKIAQIGGIIGSGIAGAGLGAGLAASDLAGGGAAAGEGAAAAEAGAAGGAAGSATTLSRLIAAGGAAAVAGLIWEWFQGYWLRIVEFVGGVILVVYGLVLLGKVGMAEG